MVRERSWGWVAAARISQASSEPWSAADIPKDEAGRKPSVPPPITTRPAMPLHPRRLAAEAVGRRQLLYPLNGSLPRNILGQVLVELLQATGLRAMAQQPVQKI